MFETNNNGRTDRKLGHPGWWCEGHREEVDSLIFDRLSEVYQDAFYTDGFGKQDRTFGYSRPATRGGGVYDQDLRIRFPTHSYYLIACK